MKTRFYSVFFGLSLSLFIFGSCKKPVATADSSVVTPVSPSALQAMDSLKTYLRQHVIAPIFRSIDTGGMDTMTIGHLRYVRVPFTGIPIQQKFILLTQDEQGVMTAAGIIEMAFTANPVTGTFRSSYLDGTLAMSGTIDEGHLSIKERQVSVNQSLTETLSLVPGAAPIYTPLPEVIVYPSSGGDPYYYLPAIRLLAPHQIYNPALGATTGGGGGTGSGYAVYTRAASSGPGATRFPSNRPTTITVELSYAKPAINVSSYFKCFDNVPSNGARYAVNVLVDLPVNDNPSQVFNPTSGAVGHAFLAFTKTNGSSSVTQYIGFAATKPFAAMFLTTAVPGKLIDNESHKYNASLTIPVSAAGFDRALNATVQQDGSSYDIANFNCVDFSLGVVNSISPNFLTVQPLPLPGSPVTMDTPGSLYLKLAQMKAAGNPNVSNDGVWIAGQSHGSCN